MLFVNNLTLPRLFITIHLLYIMTEIPKDQSLEAEWGDFTSSPKGDEKKMLSEILLPSLVHDLRAAGMPFRSMLDVGADTGQITDFIREPVAMGDPTTLHYTCASYRNNCD